MNRLLACCGIVIVSLCWGSFVNAAEFWQSGWSTPQKAESSSLLVRPIEAADAERLFHSYMGSQRYLYSQLGWSWPSEKSSLEQNQSMVKLHLKQWQQQTAAHAPVGDLAVAKTYVVRRPADPTRIPEAVANL